MTLEKQIEVKNTPTCTNDPLPEFCHYRDEGCELATKELGQPSRCARCPFPDCLTPSPPASGNG